MPAATVDRHVPAPPEAAWRAFTTADELAAWFWPPSFGTEVVLVPEPGARLRIVSPARGMGVEGAVLEADAPRRLVLLWRWYGEAAETTVTIEVTPADGGSAVRVRHEGFATEDEARDHEQGWSDCLDRLVARLGGAG